jgi:hypothetical protein
VGTIVPHDIETSGSFSANATYGGMWSKLTNTGSASVSGANHGVAFIGYGLDNVNGTHPIVGTEGKVDAFGKALYYNAMWAIPTFTGSTFNGQEMRGLTVWSRITSDGSTALASGTNIGVRVEALTGGAAKYAFLGFDPIATVGSTVTALSADLSKSVYLQHDGSNGIIATSNGNLIFGPTSGYTIMGSSSTAFIPLVNGGALGIGSNAWAGTFTTITTSDNVAIGVAGKGLQIKEGANARMGTATLVSGAVTVSNTSVTASSRFQLTEHGSTINAVGISAVVAGTSFTIKSSSGTDTNTVDWIIFEPSP